MKTRYKRLTLVGAGLAMLGVSAWLILGAFQKNLVFFFTPTQILAGESPHGRSFRVGGMVQGGSLVHEPGGLVWSFVVTDMAHTVDVRYRGILPDLFKEGKGVVAEGKLAAEDVFEAEQVLAKHDENYMPPDAAYALKKGAESNRNSQQIAAQPGSRPTMQAATQNADAK